MAHQALHFMDFGFEGDGVFSIESGLDTLHALFGVPKKISGDLLNKRWIMIEVFQ